MYKKKILQSTTCYRFMWAGSLSLFVLYLTPSVLSPFAPSLS